MKSIFFKPIVREWFTKVRPFAVIQVNAMFFTFMQIIFERPKLFVIISIIIQLLLNSFFNAIRSISKNSSEIVHEWFIEKTNVNFIAFQFSFIHIRRRKIDFIFQNKSFVNGLFTPLTYHSIDSSKNDFFKVVISKQFHFIKQLVHFCFEIVGERITYLHRSRTIHLRRFLELFPNKFSIFPHNFSS